MKLRVVHDSGQEPPAPQSKRRFRVSPLFVLVAIVAALWGFLYWVVQPVSPEYLRRHLPTYSQCVKRELAMSLRPISRYRIWGRKYVCDGLEDDANLTAAQQNALGDVR